jgi:hypothetical protein
MKKTALVLLAMIAVTALAQVKKEQSPFDKYRQSTVSEFEFRKTKFEVAAIRASLQPTPLPNGVGAPHIEGETAEGKLVIQVDVWASDLPQTIDGRKDVLMQAVGVSLAAWSYAFDAVDADKSMKKWAVIQFWDDERLAKHHGTKPVDPYIGIYENGELVLR